MPRGSLKHEDAMQAGFIQEGNVEITSSVVAIHQFPPNSKTGVQSDAFTAVRWTVKKLNEDWSEQDEGASEQINIRLGKVEDMRPGNLTKPDDLDEEPEDLGSEVETEGNSLYVEPDKRVGRNWAAMEESLRKAGFRPDVIGRCYLPDFNGMKCHLKTIAAGKYKTKDGEEKDATNLVVDKIHTFPYEIKKGKTNAKVTAKTAAPVTSAKANETPAASNGEGDTLALAKKVLEGRSTQFQAIIPNGKATKRGVFQMQFAQELMRQKVSNYKPVLELVKDDEQLIQLATEMEFMVDLDAGTVTL